jgi:hypothetical protein
MLCIRWRQVVSLMIRPLYPHGPGPWAWWRSNVPVQLTAGESLYRIFFGFCRALNLRKETVIRGRTHLTLVAQRSGPERCAVAVLHIHCCPRHGRRNKCDRLHFVADFRSCTPPPPPQKYAAVRRYISDVRCFCTFCGLRSRVMGLYGHRVCIKGSRVSGNKSV